MSGGNRADHNGAHRRIFERNKQMILKTQDCCAICGQPVDKKLRFPHPLSATVDHIVPIDKGGHPSDAANLQLAHFTCNRQKSNKLTAEQAVVNKAAVTGVISNRVLPQARNWSRYRAE